MAFPLRHPVVAGIVVGTRSAGEARRNAEAFAAHIPAQVWADLRAEGLLDGRAPVDS
jgi:D-threo-aldose 1-dehydrogenase